MTDFKYSVEVQKFKPSGKYIDTVSFGTNSEWFNEVVEEFRKAIINNQIERRADYCLTGKLADGEDHPNGYPVLIRGMF
jgi:hypothetical protein